MLPPVPPYSAENICDSRNVHQPGADGVDHKLGGLVNAERVHNVGAMDRNCIRTQIENCGDFLVRLAIDDHLQYLKFARRETSTALPFECGGLLHLGIKERFSSGHA